jgi:CheY-like chemotaxis protein
VIAVASGAEALKAVTAYQPDVLISDIAMPGMDGLEFIRQLRDLGPEDGGRVPAIAVTAHASAREAAMTLTAGFDRHVAKPIEAADLISAVAQLAGVARIARTRG